MKIVLVHRQRRRHPAAAPLRKLAAWLFARAFKDAPTDDWRQLTLVLTGDAEIRALNAAWCGRDAVTDVISFRHPPLPGEPGVEGELILNLEQAWQEGRLRDGPARELALYLAHGCDHLAGGEDDTPSRKRAMLARERRWVAEAEKLGLVPPTLLRATRTQS
jgi:rRNA maturation RNase YbeY